MVRLIPLFALLSLWMPASLAAQPTGHSDVSERIERSRQVARWPERIRDSLATPQWLPRGDRLILWDAIGAAAGTWVLVDAATGMRTTLIAPAVLRERLAALTGAAVTLPVQMPFVLTHAGRGLVFRYADKSYCLDIATAAVRRAEDGAIDALLSAGGQASPLGDRVAMQQGDGFSVVDAAGRPVLARTGVADLGWMLPDKAWSPDGRLAIWQVDQRAVHHIPIVDYADAAERVSLVPYAKVGTPIARSVLHLFDPASGALTPVRIAPDEGYLWLAGWRGDGNALVLRMARDGKRIDLLVIARDGMVRRLLREARCDTKVADLNFAVSGWATQVTPLPRGGGFLWMSERDGWRHVYHYSDDGRLIAQRTRGAFPVARVEHAAANGSLLVTASADPANAYDELLYRVGPATRDLHPVATEPGVHGVQPSPSGRYMIDSRSSWTSPRVRDLRRADGTVITRLTTADARGVGTLRTPPEPITVRTADDGTPLHGALFRPHGFDPAQRYPVIAYIYGGPFGTVLSRTFTGNTMMRRAEALAAAGFVVIAVDVRGSAGRSKAFGDATYGRIGQSEVDDYVTALRQTGATRPWMDLSRVGIHGHSWGGYFAIRAMLTAPDVFKAGYAGAPGALDQDALVNEPDMGLRAANPSGYAAGSNLLLADRLKGALRIMHGSADVNAPISSTMRLVQAMIRADKPVDLLVMPGAGHDPEGQDEDYYRDDVVRFFLTQLK